MTFDEQTILAALADQLQPDQVLMLAPDPELQARVSLLLSQNKIRRLLPEEESELEKYLALEHQVRIVKIYAYQQHVSSTLLGMP